MTPENDAKERAAKSRYLQLTMLRIAGMITVLLGAAIWQKGVLGLQDELIGKIFMVVGVAEMFLVPALLRRAWREKP